MERSASGRPNKKEETKEEETTIIKMMAGRKNDFK